MHLPHSAYPSVATEQFRHITGENTSLFHLGPRVHYCEQITGFINNYAEPYVVVVVPLSTNSYSGLPSCRIKWILLSRFMLELRERGGASGVPSSPSQLEDLGTFHATVGFVRRTCQEDFGEPLYPVGSMVDPNDSDDTEAMSNSEDAELSRNDIVFEV